MLAGYIITFAGNMIWKIWASTKIWYYTECRKSSCRISFLIHTELYTISIFKSCLLPQIIFKKITYSPSSYHDWIPCKSMLYIHVSIAIIILCIQGDNIHTLWCWISGFFCGAGMAATEYWDVLISVLPACWRADVVAEINFPTENMVG